MISADPNRRPFDNGVYRSFDAKLNAKLREFTAGLVELDRSVGLRHSRAVAPLLDHMAEYVMRPGKRLRPYFCKLGYSIHTDAQGEIPDGVAGFCAAIEVIHAFLLIHDDVADRATSRRGRPALQVLLRPSTDEGVGVEYASRIGDDLAIVAGDVLYTAALQAMLRPAGVDRDLAMRALEEMISACRAAGVGQCMDIALSARPLAAVTPSEILELDRLKTASYTFEGPLAAGALLGDAPADLLPSLRQFCAAAGVAFQVQDDLFALFAEDDQLGKPGLADLKEGKKTWPLVIAFQESTQADRRWLEERLRRRDANPDDLRRVQRILRATRSLDRALELVRTHCERGERALAGLSETRSISELRAFNAWLLERTDSIERLWLAPAGQSGFAKEGTHASAQPSDSLDATHGPR
jgi:geranylgeranyl diphosphate synthase type I